MVSLSTVPPTIRRRLVWCGLLLTMAPLWGCSKEIGDPCVLSVDCGIQNNRTCDTSQTGGYCTQGGCTANACPDEAGCFLFEPRVPGCSYDDREAARNSRAYCMRSCDDDGDCRVGYVCADVTQEPWRAVLLDDEEPNPRACIAPASFDEGSRNEDAPICQPTVVGGDLVDAGGSAEPAADAAP